MAVSMMLGLLLLLATSMPHCDAQAARTSIEKLDQTVNLLREIHARVFEYRVQIQRLEALFKDAVMTECGDGGYMIRHSFSNIGQSLDNIATMVGTVELNVNSLGGTIHGPRPQTRSLSPPSEEVRENHQLLLDVQNSLRRIEQTVHNLQSHGTYVGGSGVSLHVLKTVISSSLNDLERNIEARLRELIAAQQAFIQDLLRAFSSKMEAHGVIGTPGHRGSGTLVSGDTVTQLVQEAFNTGLSVYSENVGHVFDRKLHAFQTMVERACSSTPPPQTKHVTERPARPDRTLTRHGERQERPREVKRYSTAGVDIVGPPDPTDRLEVGKRLSQGSLEQMYRHHRPPNCADIHKLGHHTSGVYEAFVDPYTEPVPVYCDMTTQNGGWTVIQRRDYKKRPYVNFDRPWSDYKKGFGDLNGEFWLGNHYIHYLTKGEPMTLRFEIVDSNGRSGFAEYDNVRILDEYHKYQLIVGQFIDGNIKDEVTSHNSTYFATPDEDNDRHPGRNCAETFFGGWWYDNCFRVNLNGLHVYPFDSKAIQGIYWGFRFPGGRRLQTAEMKLRPSNYRGRPAYG